MTESQWLQATEPNEMLKAIGAFDQRKLRLFACACCRQVWHCLPHQRSRQAVETAERFADGQVTAEELLKDARAAAGATAIATASAAIADTAAIAAWSAAAWSGAVAEEVAEAAVWNALRATPGAAIWNAAGAKAGDAAWHAAWDAARSAQADLLREIFGNLFQPVAVGVVPVRARDMAAGLYQERDWIALPVLADMLEDAGTTSAVVAHLRTPGPHVRGCWALDLVLGKQ